MEKFLMDYLTIDKDIDKFECYFEYLEDINNDALSDAWLDSRTSYIYKVGVLCAIDSNKCDFAHVVIATMRNEYSEPIIKGYFYFNEGENDDMGRTIKRAINLIQTVHPSFDLER